MLYLSTGAVVALARADDPDTRAASEEFGRIREALSTACDLPSDVQSSAITELLRATRLLQRAARTLARRHRLRHAVHVARHRSLCDRRGDLTEAGKAIAKRGVMGWYCPRGCRRGVYPANKPRWWWQSRDRRQPQWAPDQPPCLCGTPDVTCPRRARCAPEPVCYTLQSKLRAIVIPADSRACRASADSGRSPADAPYLGGTPPAAARRPTTTLAQGPPSHAGKKTRDQSALSWALEEERAGRGGFRAHDDDSRRRAALKAEAREQLRESIRHDEDRQERYELERAIATEAADAVGGDFRGAVFDAYRGTEGARRGDAPARGARAGQAAASTAAGAADAAMQGWVRKAAGRARGVTGGECVVGACAGGGAGSEEGSDEEASDEEALFAAQVGP